MPRLVAANDRVLFYFAGHGIAADGDDGPAGYLVPADADPMDMKTLVPMAELQDALQALPCRHLLLILDCCFSGAFQWASRSRAIGSLMPKRIYKERFDRFVLDPAWQVITSAAYDQKAMDVLQGRATGDRGVAKTAAGEAHSPFALALFDALAGEADFRTGREGDGVITATEVYAYVRDRVEPETLDARQNKRQTPGFFPLRKHDKGEFIFLHPKHRLNLPRNTERSPYKGLQSFDESDRSLFYGRDRAIRELQARCDAVRLLVVSGASGTGKSSVVKAGLLPLLREAGHRILPVVRPGIHPLAALEQALTEVGAGSPKAVLLVDQFEELITRCPDENERKAFIARLRQVVDDEASDPSRHHHRTLGFRAAGERRRSQGRLERRTLYRAALQPRGAEGNHRHADDAGGADLRPTRVGGGDCRRRRAVSRRAVPPGVCPERAVRGLSRQRTRGSRAEKNRLRALGGVMGALRSKADNLYQTLEPAEQATMRKIMLRMVSVEGDLAGRRVPMADLDYSTDESPRVQTVIERLVESRLMVKEQDSIEPAHDALVRAWKTLHEWIHAVGRDTLILGVRLGREADQFRRPVTPVAVEQEPQPRRRRSRAEGSATRLQRQGSGVHATERRTQSSARNSWPGPSPFATLVSLMALSVWALLERATAEEQKERALLSLFEGLSLNMNRGQPGSLCVYGLCDAAPPGDGRERVAFARAVARRPRKVRRATVSRGFSPPGASSAAEVSSCTRRTV